MKVVHIQLKGRKQPATVWDAAATTRERVAGCLLCARRAHSGTNTGNTVRCAIVTSDTMPTTRRAGQRVQANIESLPDSVLALVFRAVGGRESL